MNVGFIGLGIMGLPMAKHVMNGGHRVCGYDLSAAAMQAWSDAGGNAVSSIAEVAEQSERIFLMLPDTGDVEQVLFGAQGLAAHLRAGQIVIDMSSISPVATRRFAETLAKQGVEMLDAPVSGGQVGAENATLTIMVGGKEQVFSQIKPFFELMGKMINLIGGNGDGQTAKLANQIIVAGTLEAVGEALLFASKAGANPENVRQALLGGFAQSRILELHGARMIEHTFKPGFRVAHQQKDLNNALASAREIGLSLPGTAVVQEMYNSVHAHGGAEQDHSALITALERMAGYELGS